MRVVRQFSLALIVCVLFAAATGQLHQQAAAQTPSPVDNSSVAESCANVADAKVKNSNSGPDAANYYRANGLYSALLGLCESDRQNWKKAASLLKAALDEMLASSDVVQLKVSYLYDWSQWRLAITEEHLGHLEDAAQMITEAYFLNKAMDGKYITDASLENDYTRIRTESKARLNAAVTAAARSEWDTMSQAQRSVVTQHGGARDSAVGRPCHMSSLETASHLQQTWWYCEPGTGNHYLEAYSFVDGQLKSRYVP